jgi:cysteine-rich repeat protein
MLNRSLSHRGHPALGLRLLAAAVTLFALSASENATAATITVPGDHATIQAALDVAVAGDVVEVENGTYNEKVTFSASGTVGLPITLQAKSGHSPIIDGTGISVAGLAGLVYIEDQSFIEISGFEIRNFFGTGPADFPAGIWLRGQSGNVEIRNNTVHSIENSGCGNCGAHGIAVYGTSGAGSIHDLVIDGNVVRDCILGWSEAMVLNGNVEDFVVSNNTVHDNNNIGIDMIGFENECSGCADGLDRARDGLVVGNLVYNIDSQGNPAYGSDRSADGIYVDGGTRITIERNIVHDVNIGIELASEHQGKDTSEITVRNNFVYDCHTTGFAMGGYNTNRGSTEDCVVVNNTFYHNDSDATGSGEMLIQYDTRNNILKNNILVAGPQNVFISNDYSANTGNTVDSNIYFSSGGANSSEWSWKGNYYTGYADWLANTGNDVGSQFTNPKLVAAGTGDLHLQATSPALNSGETLSPTLIGSLDIDGDDRVNGAAVDIGADERTECGDGVIDGSEECDDSNLIDGDGCDSNCSTTACGNTILTAGEQCDDGNLADGDCCSSGCLFESLGASCDDNEICSLTDECDGAGICVGTSTPEPSCLVPSLGTRGAQIKLSSRGGNKDKLTWKWGKGPEALLAALGTPDIADEMAFCIFVDEGAGSEIFLSAEVPAGASWQLKGSSTYKYKDSDLQPDGIRQVQMKAGVAGKAKAKVQGKGSNLGLPSLPLAPTATVTTQLHNLANGTCFGATFPTPFRRNDEQNFQAQTD